jgi:ribosome-binding protein aMBF1 (putative translation factor)
MAKYSTGRGGDDDGGACELCGRESSKLRRANVAGADLLVCPDCAPHGDNRHKDRRTEQSRSDRDGSETSRRKRAAQNVARARDAAQSPGRWEERGTNYEKDRLPYLVADYGERVTAARQAAGLAVGELAAELDADEADVRAVEEGRATRAGVGGTLVRRLEERFDIDIVDE